MLPATPNHVGRMRRDESGCRTALARMAEAIPPELNPTYYKGNIPSEQPGGAFVLYRFENHPTKVFAFR